IVPIIEAQRGRWKADFEGKKRELSGLREVEEFERRLADTGVYAWRCEPEEAERFRNDSGFREIVDRKLRTERLHSWVELADRWLENHEGQVFISAGNDDPWFVDSVIQKSSKMIWPEGRVLEISDSLVMLSSGVANLTPWNCPRDISEDEIAARIEGMA